MEPPATSSAGIQHIPADRLRLGVAGLGLAGAFMIRAARVHPNIHLAAGMDPVAAPRDAFRRDFDAAVYADFDGLCADPSLDAIYIASPHRFHADQAVQALEAGKHVLVEKPLALNIQSCDRVVDAADRTGHVVVVGHSHAFDPTIRALRQLLRSGELGSAVMILAFNYTDYIYRPHGRDEFVPGYGGGILFNQLTHQVEMIRALVGRDLLAVRAQLGRLDASRGIDGHAMAFLEFSGGAVASLVYSGYGYFDSDEFHHWVSEGGALKSERHSFLRSTQTNRMDPTANLGLAYGARTLPVEQPYLPHFGELVVTCERGDVRPSAEGLTIHDANGTRQIAVARGLGRPGQGDALDALVDAVRHGRPTLHDARWGRSTVEALLAIARSSDQGRRVELRELG